MEFIMEVLHEKKQKNQYNIQDNKDNSYNLINFLHKNLLKEIHLANKL